MTLRIFTQPPPRRPHRGAVNETPRDLLYAPPEAVAALGAAAVDEIRQDVLLRLLDSAEGKLRGARSPIAYSRLSSSARSSSLPAVVASFRAATGLGYSNTECGAAFPWNCGRSSKCVPSQVASVLTVPHLARSTLPLAGASTRPRVIGLRPRSGLLASGVAQSTG